MLDGNIRHLAFIQDQDVPKLIKRHFSRTTNKWEMVKPCIVDSDKCPITYQYPPDSEFFSINIPLSVWLDDLTPTCVWIKIYYRVKCAYTTPIVTLRDIDDPFDHPRIVWMAGTKTIRINDLWTPVVNFTTFINSVAACLSAPLRPMSTKNSATRCWLTVHYLSLPPIRMQADTVAEVMHNLETSVTTTTDNICLSHCGRWIDTTQGDAVPLEQFGVLEYENQLVVTFKPCESEKIEEDDY